MISLGGNRTFLLITQEIECTPSAMFKKHLIDEIEYLPSLLFGEESQFELNATSFKEIEKKYNSLIFV